jgi:hypothetical protein
MRSRLGFRRGGHRVELNNLIGAIPAGLTLESL